jgi:hypothetical protein
MASANDYAADGTVLGLRDDLIVFQPRGFTYELWLVASSQYAGGIGEPVRGVIRVGARKIYTVPSGGAFIEPIAGPPRTIQGRVKHLDEQQMVVQAAAPIVVELPRDGSAFDLTSGPIAVGGLVNVSVFPGGSVERIFRGA